MNENVRISIKFPLKFVPKGPINNIPALAQIMTWRRPGDKPLSEPVMVSLLTHICITRPQRVKKHRQLISDPRLTFPGEVTSLNLPAAVGITSLISHLTQFTVSPNFCGFLKKRKTVLLKLPDTVWVSLKKWRLLQNFSNPRVVRCPAVSHDDVRTIMEVLHWLPVDTPHIGPAILFQ